MLEKLPQRAGLLARLTQLWNYPRTSLPVEEAGQLFYRHNSGLQKQAPLYRRATPDALPQLLLDPNTLSADGSISLADWAPSPDGRYLAYALSQGGADWAEVRLRDIATGIDLPDVVRWYRFSGIAWTKDSKGFFYGRFPEPPPGKALEAELLDHQIHYHRVGTAQDQDRLIYWRRDLPRYFVDAAVTEDGRYLIVTLENGTDPRNRLLYADLGDPLQPDLDAPVEAIVDEDMAELTVLGNEGPVLFVRTRPRCAEPAGRRDRPAAAQRPCRLEVHRCGKHERPRERDDCRRQAVLPIPRGRQERRTRSIRSAGEAEGALELPGIASVAGMSGRAHGTELFYDVSSPLVAPSVFRYDIADRDDVRRSAPDAAHLRSLRL